MAKTKVLMIVENNAAPGDRRVWPEAITLRDHGYQVSVISPKGTAKYHEAYICIDGIHVYRYHQPEMGHGAVAYLIEYGVAFLMVFLLSLKVWRRRGFDVIHAANPPDIFFPMALFYRMFGKKFVFDQHDLSPELFQVKFAKKTWLYNLLLFLERCSYRLAHLVITSNVSQKGFAIERGHCAAERVFVVRNGPNWQEMRPNAPEPELKRGFPFMLAYVGLIEVQDGVEYCLYAMDRLVNSCGRKDVLLVIMGGGGQLSWLKSLAHRLHLDEYIDFKGFTPHDDVIRYISSADVGLVPDPQNGMNEYCTMIKTMEYMALGRPVVAFDLLETRCSAQEGALYARPNVVEDFAGKIAMLLDNAELRQRLGEIGRERVLESLCWEKTSENLVLAYDRLGCRVSAAASVAHQQP